MIEKINELRDTFFEYNGNHRSFIDGKFREKGLYYGQPPILKYLNEHKNATQKEIADYLHISAPSVATSLKRMEESGLVTRLESKTDARKNVLKLTKKGKELIEYADNLFLRIDDVTFNNFTVEELDMLISLLRRMNNNLIEYSNREEDQNV